MQDYGLLRLKPRNDAVVCFFVIARFCKESWQSIILHFFKDFIVEFSLCKIMDCFGQSPRNDKNHCVIARNEQSE
ncbi:hypothetical protein [Helicobacter rodentium]|uniref:hypothetical protein n=1 Tax=Helicobacter rodentium TaxID=59617 RepID=UPI0023576042|nr:hypothetical protein [Helicobacter rodentium]